jgi:DNA-binding MarR family transcriptional regulator
MFLTGGGLGEPGHRVLVHLDDQEGHTTRDLAEITRLPIGTVRKVLNTMQSLGMAERDDDGHWRVHQFDPDDIAIKVDTAGKGARRRAQHDKEATKRQEAIRKWAKTQKQQSPNN